MGIADMARDKALKELYKAREDIVRYQEQVSKAQAHADAVQKAADDAVHAQKSAVQAQIDALNVKIGQAEDDLESARGASDLTDTVAKVPLVGALAAPAQQAASAKESQARAELDALHAQLSQVQSQLSAPPPDPSSDLTKAQLDVQIAKTKLDGAQTREKVAQKALDTLS